MPELLRELGGGSLLLLFYEVRARSVGLGRGQEGAQACPNSGTEQNSGPGVWDLDPFYSHGSTTPLATRIMNTTSPSTHRIKLVRFE